MNDRILEACFKSAAFNLEVYDGLDKTGYIQSGADILVDDLSEAVLQLKTWLDNSHEEINALIRHNSELEDEISLLVDETCDQQDRIEDLEEEVEGLDDALIQYEDAFGDLPDNDEEEEETFREYDADNYGLDCCFEDVDPEVLQAEELVDAFATAVVRLLEARPALR